MTTPMNETVEPTSIAKNHRAAPVPVPAGPRILRRETWVDIGPEYDGFRAQLWINYPRRLLDDLNQSEDVDLRKQALSQMVIATNGWLDYDGTPFPPASDPAFWDAIPDELAATLIALVNREAGKLALVAHQLAYPGRAAFIVDEAVTVTEDALGARTLGDLVHRRWQKECADAKTTRLLSRLSWADRRPVYGRHGRIGCWATLSYRFLPCLSAIEVWTKNVMLSSS